MFAQFRQGGGSGGVAGHHQHLDALVHQTARSLERVADDGVTAFGAVGQAGRITKIEQVLAGQAAGDGFEHGQAAHAGIKDADGQGSRGVHDVPSMGDGPGGASPGWHVVGTEGRKAPLPAGRTGRAASGCGGIRSGASCPDCGRMAFFTRQGKGKRVPEAWRPSFPCPFRFPGRASRAARGPATDSAGT